MGGTLAVQPHSLVCNVRCCGCSSAGACPEHTNTRDTSVPGGHPWGAVSPPPGTPFGQHEGKDKSSTGREGQEQHSEVGAQVLFCRQRCESQSKSQVFIASAVGKPRC